MVYEDRTTAQSDKHTISVQVENEFGVLARVSSMFAARGYNIDSLCVAPTLDPKISHITLVTNGSPQIIEQILKQLNRLVDVIEVRDLTGENFINRETVLITVQKLQTTRDEILKLTETFRGNLVDEAESSLIIQLTEESYQIETFIKQIGKFKILDLARTGTIAVER